jgi:hypothetical protein
VSCIALALSLTCAAFAAHAQTESGPLASITGDGLLATIGSVLFALLAGYAKGQDRRITALEHEQRQQQSQINMLSERVLREHPSKAEFAGLREEMQDGFGKLESLILGRL